MSKWLIALVCAPALFGELRPPAVPLVVHDPYFSIWSMSDRLTDTPTKHWTGTDQPMTGLVRVDGKTMRFLGTMPRNTPAMAQVSRELTPTRTIYGFESSGVHLTLTFLTPAIASDMEILSRPVTYVTFDARSTDSQPHAVSLYFDAGSQIAVNVPEQKVVWSRNRIGELDVVRIGSAEQPVLGKSGDNLRIDWGYFYLAVPKGEVLAGNRTARDQFAASGSFPDADDLDMPRAVGENSPVAAVHFDLGQVGTAPVTKHLLLAYDDVFAIEYFQRKLRAYWRRNGMGPDGLLRAAEKDYDSLRERCIQFDRELTADLVKEGGQKYAELAILTYRQTLAAHKLVADLDGTPLYFSKENFSNGSIDTVDVTYPSSPFFLLLNPELLKAQIRPILDYASLARWPWPYAPHDLGKYPLANGQLYGGGEKSEENQMPVEESGNMLIMVAALAHADHDAAFAKKYWPVLTKWEQYLEHNGLHPGNQLSTDDFAGHLANNTNLAIKAILGIASYEMLEGKSYNPAKSMAKSWAQEADDGDHYRLAFDKPGTWSEKYNLVWDKVLGFHVFPPDVAAKELAFYKTKQNAFGLPLDNRAQYTKLDWVVWTATLADKQPDFLTLADAAYKFANETPDRVPLSDWYETVDGKHRGFQARSVVGGVYMKMLADPEMWKKWAGRAGARP
ncbi:MAG: glutaminase [Bryobacterales bacterium]|nr:glutaminase [Bryobacterales bacterium]